MAVADRLASVVGTTLATRRARASAAGSYPVRAVGAFDVAVAALAEPQLSAIASLRTVCRVARAEALVFGPAPERAERDAELLQVRRRDPFQARDLPTPPALDIGRCQPADTDQHVDRRYSLVFGHGRVRGGGDPPFQPPEVLGLHGRSDYSLPV